MELKPGYKQTEVGVIPEDWKVVEYNRIGQIIDGDRGVHYPSSGELKDAGYCLFLNAGNVTKSGFQFEDCAFITKEKDEKLNKGKLRRYDVVLTTRGTVGNFVYFDESVNHENVRINSGMVILRNTSKDIDTKYQYVVLRSKVVGLQVERMAFGSAQPQLTVKGINLFKIPLPPTKAEQTAIANALSDADALIQSLTRLIAKKRQIKQAAMQTLLNPYENGRLKEGWMVKKLGNVAELINGRAYSLLEWESHGIPVIRLQNLTGRGEQYYYSNLKLPEKQYCVAGDLLFMWSATFGPVIWKGEKAIYHYHIWKIDCNPSKVNKLYLYYILNDLTEHLKKTSSSGGTMLHVTKEKMESTEIIFPNIGEQTRIATILSDMDAEIAEIEAKLAKYQQIKQGMMQNLLTGRVRLVKPESNAGAVA